MTQLTLKDLTMDNIGQWPWLLKLILTMFVALAILFGGYWLFIAPDFEEHDALLTEQAKLKGDFEKKQSMAANLEAYKFQMAIMKERFGSMLRQLPAQDEMAALLEDISRTGTSMGLTFELFEPMPEIAHDFYSELPINIKVLGSYQELALFVSRIVQMSRIVTLHDFDIVNAKDNSSQVPLHKVQENQGELLRMSIVVKIYRYRSPGEQAQTKINAKVPIKK